MAGQNKPPKGGSDFDSGAASAPAPRKLTGSGTPAKTAGPLTADGQPRVFTTVQKELQGSGFSDAARDRQRNTLIGSQGKDLRPSLADDEDDDTLLEFDGLQAPPELTGRDLWKAVQAPMQSAEGRRSQQVYLSVLKQFAVGTNPRYEPDAPERYRSHIFVWDVTRAMGCEIPHFVGAKELSLVQTCDWLRHEGPMRGWSRTSAAGVIALAKKGQPVIAMPKDPRLKGLALVYPQKDTAFPKVVGAGARRGWGLPLADVIGVSQAEFFTHA